MEAKLIGHIGDVNYIEYGGGPVYDAGGYHVVEYTNGIESECPDYDEDEADSAPCALTVYSVHVNPDFAGENDWIDWSAVADSIGSEDDELIAAARSKDPWQKIWALESAAGYYGWHEFDQYAREVDVKELEEKWSDAVDEPRRNPTRGRKAKGRRPVSRAGRRPGRGVGARPGAAPTFRGKKLRHRGTKKPRRNPRETRGGVRPGSPVDIGDRREKLIIDGMNKLAKKFSFKMMHIPNQSHRIDSRGNISFYIDQPTTGRAKRFPPALVKLMNDSGEPDFQYVHDMSNGVEANHFAWEKLLLDAGINRRDLIAIQKEQGSPAPWKRTPAPRGEPRRNPIKTDYIDREHNRYFFDTTRREILKSWDIREKPPVLVARSDWTREESIFAEREERDTRGPHRNPVGSGRAARRPGRRPVRGPTRPGGPSRNPRDEEGMLTRDWNRDRIDDEAARELELWIPNTYECYRHYQAVAKNMTRKKAAGKYDREKAVQGFMYTTEMGAKIYAKDVGGGKWFELFNKPTREHVARELRDQWEGEFENGEWDEYIPKKYRKKKKAAKKKAGKAKSPKRNPQEWWRIEYANGRIAETKTPMSDLQSDYPDVFVWGEQFQDVLFTDNDIREALQHEGNRVLVWASEEESINDPGQNTIASITGPTT